MRLLAHRAVLLGLVRNPKTRYKIWKKHEAKMVQYGFFDAKYVKETISSFKGLFRLYERSIFDTTDAVFEGITVKIPAGYDHYMKMIYGDYMAIPKNLSIDMASRYGVVKYINLHEPYTTYRFFPAQEGEGRCGSELTKPGTKRQAAAPVFLL